MTHKYGKSPTTTKSHTAVGLTKSISNQLGQHRGSILLKVHFDMTFNIFHVVVEKLQCYWFSTHLDSSFCGWSDFSFNELHIFVIKHIKSNVQATAKIRKIAKNHGDFQTLKIRKNAFLTFWNPILENIRKDVLNNHLNQKCSILKK